MQLDSFDYHLPKSLIAQRPLEDRSASRLMVVDRAAGTRKTDVFRDLPDHLSEGDLIVINRSRVIPARMYLYKSTGGKFEFFISRVHGCVRFSALANPLRRIKPGDVLSDESGEIVVEVLAREGDREVLAEIVSGHTLRETLDAIGHVPLPPYIQRPDEAADHDRYQTVFATEDGSVAAPTAGLHFTDELLSRLEKRGITTASLVLHVGLGTFLPLDNDEVEKNELHKETYTISGATLGAISETKQKGGRVVAVGTTATRVLETVAGRGLIDRFDPSRDYVGQTGLFIYPGYEFKCVDRLITNFHLPRSSLLLLVCAFLGTDRTFDCYRAAVDEEYRFYSYGDAMLIL
jgi:S-adenosylmethionine:tRNA ribosyltransferase-isomerase